MNGRSSEGILVLLVAVILTAEVAFFVWLGLTHGWIFAGLCFAALHAGSFAVLATIIWLDSRPSRPLRRA